MIFVALVRKEASGTPAYQSTRPRQTLKLYGRGLACSGLVELEVFALLKCECLRDHVRRENLEPVVQVADVGIVEPPRALQAVLGVGQLFLQFQVNLVGL